MSALIMIVSAVAIILFVKFGLLRGIDHIANAMNWSANPSYGVIWPQRFFQCFLGGIGRSF
jgi:hypothetical protein